MLIDLLVCDRIKSQLSEGALCHILSLENHSEDGWLRLGELVEALDVFYTTHSVFDQPRVTAAAVSGAKQKPPRPPPPVNVKTNFATAKASNVSNRAGADKPSVKR